jgi:hypothetical protein
VKLGIENRKQVIFLAGLGGIALLMLGRALWPSMPATAPAAETTTVTAARSGVRHTASGKVAPAVEPRLDPTLDLNLLRQSEETKYTGNGRNIFVAGAVPIEPAKKNGTTDVKDAVSATLRQPPPTPPPPPITLKFFGFANRPGETKKVFLSQGDDIFIAAEGDIVDRRYRVIHISPTTVDVEDVINNNRQSLPLTHG